ncbi:XRE family transcriptional regulator [Sphingomonas morindae]|uniref:XRE family transcriptional regulator n=1 Tax=Sphingomonas morindae TaxID=1541170 RepID=A0ABY4X545_9SPHN|nr:XRE family transcriptional regulator [Sphingomonas morindae]USI72010.1 XRE family transcriptional regulator [Sphingomonas morindae]
MGDPYRSLVFPNAIRRARRAAGFATLLALAAHLPDLAYIRLSKIERGEIFAKPEEVRAIAAVLALPPERLLIDIDAPDFDIAAWAAELRDWHPAPPDEDRFAILLGAAVRALRARAPGLTIAAIEARHHIPPVMLSRVEAAMKPFGRWHPGLRAALCDLLGVADEAALRAHVEALAETDALAPFIAAIAAPEIRIAKTHARVAALRLALTGAASAPARRPPPPRRDPPSPPPARAVDPAPADREMRAVPLLPVFGTPRADGLIGRTPLGQWVEAPSVAGPRAYGLRSDRQSLGLGLPAGAILIVDPDRFPAPGTLAVLREAEGMRLLAIGLDREGQMRGHSVNPPRDIAIDACDPADLATVIAARF